MCNVTADSDLCNVTADSDLCNITADSDLCNATADSDLCKATADIAASADSATCASSQRVATFYLSVNADKFNTCQFNYRLIEMGSCTTYIHPDSQLACRAQLAQSRHAHCELPRAFTACKHIYGVSMAQVQELSPAQLDGKLVVEVLLRVMCNRGVMGHLCLFWGAVQNCF